MRLRISIIDPVGMKAGLDHYNSCLAESLTELGYPTYVFSNYDDKFSKSVFHFSFAWKIKNKLLFIKSFFRALKLSANNNCNVVILHLFHSSFIEYLFLRSIRSRGFRPVVILHDVESFVRRDAGRYLLKCFSLSEVIFVHNRSSRNGLFHIISVNNRNKVHIIPHGNYIDLQQRNKSEISRRNPSKKNLLFFGMLKQSKGIDILLEAFMTLPENIHLTIAGRLRDISSEEITGMISNRGIAGRVELITRYISNDERNILFNGADVVVLPYRKIYQSGVMIMAMSYGIPVIASDLPGNKEIIVSGNNGILFKDGNAEDLAEKINLIMNNNDLRNIIGESGRNYVIKNHDWKITASKIIQALSE
jgi:D-inositol-3-phosphate glycosyltransferase